MKGLVINLLGFSSSLYFLNIPLGWFNVVFTFFISLFFFVIKQVGGNSSNDPAALVDEFSFLNQLPGTTLTKQDVLNHFKYYVIDHSILVALLEEPIVNDSDSGKNDKLQIFILYL